MLTNLRQFGKLFGQTARLMVGMPDYQTYLAHMRANHPDQPAMNAEEFFLERLNARYNTAEGRPGRCC